MTRIYLYIIKRGILSRLSADISISVYSSPTLMQYVVGKLSAVCIRPM